MRSILHLIILAFLLAGQTSLAEVKRYKECYRMFFELRAATEESHAKLKRGERAPAVTAKSYGAKMPNMHAAESEGTYYHDISMWFDTIDRKKFAKSLELTLAGKQEEAAKRKQADLKKFLDDWPKKYRPQKAHTRRPKNWKDMTDDEKYEYKEALALKQQDYNRFMKEWPNLEFEQVEVPIPKDWHKWSYKKRIAYLVKSEKNPFELINLAGRDQLFIREILTYDHLLNTKVTPPHMSVVNDWEGWEVKTAKGLADRAKYEKWRDMAEDGLEGMVGHQHIVHGWPASAAKRKEIAPKYIEMIDATSWYLYLRQMNRNPNDVDSILSHKYLNLYTDPMLDRLEKAFIGGKPEDFEERFRTIGAKNFPPMPGQNTNGMKRVPSIEFRSGNKHEKRDVMKDVVEARLVSGDYSGLRSRHYYDFRANVPTRSVISKWIPKEENLKAIEEFEDIFEYPPLTAKFNPDARAANHLHTKLIAPLLPWDQRLNIEYKIDVFHRAQKRYAEGYLATAKKYLRKYPKVRGNTQAVYDLREEIMEELETLNYRFFRRLRLDMDFAHYLAPKPKDLPAITVKSGKTVDVNHLDLGIEYSFRFSERPRAKSNAEKQIKAAAVRLCEEFGCDPKTQITRKTEGGHGHGLSIRYLVEDQHGRKWRVEWDGIKRDYDKKKIPINPRGGHIEVPTPKFAPQNMLEVIQLYKAMGAVGNYPKRIAGGAHLNFDLKPILELKPKRLAGEKLANIVRFFESNSRMVQFLWQHPARLRVAAPAPDPEFFPEFLEAINKFEGSPDQLAKLLYDKRYFNTYVDRKPAYVQLNLTGMMHDDAPNFYHRSIDIKKPGQKWFPSFSGKAGDRAELRLNDAPLDPYIAALQIKYYRALLNKALNTKGKIELKPLYSDADFESWKGNADKFMQAAAAHVRSLGLDPEEFRPIFIQSWDTQMYKPKLQFNRTIYERFFQEEEEELGRGGGRRMYREEEEEEELTDYFLRRRRQRQQQLLEE